MATTEPEKTITLVKEAVATLESKAVVDRQFPDLYKTFTHPSLYASNQAEAVQPILLKKNITLSTSGLEDIRKFDHKSPCGIAPLINRAYFVVKNHLHLFDYVESRGIMIHETENDIVGVGFVKPKPGIFVDRVKQLMIIATTSEISVIGVVNGPQGLNYVNSFISTVTNGVHMLQIVGTNQGRIFMLGNDDNVWELDYRAQETWFASKCNKKLQTSGSSFGFLFRKSSDPIVQIAVNESGTVLYQLTKNSTINVVYLGTDGYTFNTVCKKSDCIADAKRSVPTSEYFIPDTQIVSIHPTTAAESLYYHLVAITSNGCRIYYNHQKDAQHVKYDAAPNGLINVHVRTPSEILKPSDLVGKSLYRNALTMLVKNAHVNETQSQIITYSPHLANLGNRTSPNSNIQLQENGNAIDIHGKILDIIESPTNSDGINEFKYPYHATPRHFLVLTTSGITVLVKQRPVDMLHNLITRAGSDTRHRPNDFEPFFNHYGYLNASSLCYNLISSIDVPNSNPLYDAKAVAAHVAKDAETLLARFGKVNSLIEDPKAQSFTSLHDGLALFTYRVIEGIWSKKLIKETSTAAGKSYSNNISTEELASIQKILTRLQTFIDRNTNLFSFTSITPETKSLNNLREFIGYLNQAMSFFTFIFEHDLNSIIKLAKSSAQASLLESDVKTLLTTSEGTSAVAGELTYALIDYTYKRYNNLEHVIDVLTSRCGSFCSAHDVLLYNAANQIHLARNVNTNQASAMLKESFDNLSKIAIHISADKATELATQYAELGYPAYGIRLAICCAKARDLTNSTNALLDANCPADKYCHQLFKSKQPFYDIILKLSKNVIKDSSHLADSRKILMKLVFESERNDKAFQFYAYDSFLQDNLAQILIEENPPNLEEYLKNPPFEYKRLKLLASYYKLRCCYENAAQVYVTLARFPDNNISLEERIQNLSAADICAKSEKAPSKQYEMNQLQQDIKQLIDSTITI